MAKKYPEWYETDADYIGYYTKLSKIPKEKIHEGAVVRVRQDKYVRIGGQWELLGSGNYDDCTEPPRRCPNCGSTNCDYEHEEGKHRCAYCGTQFR